jgi:Domain of unknown function (DUF222)/HNH endonuclease
MEHLDLDHRSIDELEQIISTCETTVTRLRAVQMAAIRRLDLLQAPLADGCRSMGEWVTGRLDVSPDTARTLVATARRLGALPAVDKAASAGELSFDRTVAVARLAETSGDEAAVLAGSAGLDVAGIHRQVARQRRLSRSREGRAFRERYVLLQPSLDASTWRLHGQLPSVAGAVIEQALHAVGDRLPDSPEACSRATRNADALWKIGQDSLTGTEWDNDAVSPQVTIFIDATDATATSAEAGVVVQAGPRVGPNTLEAIACDSIIEVTAATADGTPINLGRRSRVVSPQLRRFVIHRDGGACTADGCDSRYRLQVHHVTPWAHGGSTDADNLTALCWYHHHVVIHGSGFRIDPVSPPRRRRFLPPRDRDPP